MFETVIDFKKSVDTVVIPDDPNNIDGLNFLSGKDLNYVKKTAMLGTVLAHVDGGVPTMILEIDQRSPFVLGETLYFFELACAISGYLLGVNPFDQPGVESYKKNMFALLGKPGYEEFREVLEKRLNN
jgi:glucose-6-phosphate isomerase